MPDVHELPGPLCQAVGGKAAPYPSRNVIVPPYCGPAFFAASDEKPIVSAAKDGLLRKPTPPQE